jgi:argininosuccinate lyase
MPSLWKPSVGLHPTFAPLNRCLPEDWFLLPFELRLQRAHAKTLTAAGIFSAAEHDAICAALDALETEFAQAPCPASTAEDLHTWMEEQLTARAGDAGKKIHTARSRNDQIATLLKMYVITSGERLAADLRELIRVGCQKGRDWAALAFPLHTHQQFAAPGSVGFWVLRYATSFDRVRRHIELCLGEWRRWCPLGAAAVAGSSVAIDRTIQARELGFEAPSPNALEATTSRDECLELLALGTQVTLHLQSLATDAIIFSQTPLRWTRYPPEFATGSSMMPNKVNPDAMELLRGECNAVAAAHDELVGILKGLPSGYNRDLQCVKPVVHRAVEKLHGLATMAAAFLRQLDFDPERLAAALSEGSVGATLRMEQLVQSGMPLREAHHAVADEVRRAADGSAPVVASPLEQYQTTGSAKPAEVRRVADELLAAIAR